MPSFEEIDSYFFAHYRPEVRFFQDVHREPEQRQEEQQGRRAY